MEIELKKYENVLRKIKAEEKLLNNLKRVMVFSGEDAFEKLSSLGLDEGAVQAVMDKLIDGGVIVRASFPSKDLKVVNVSLSKRFRRCDSYIFVREGSQRMNLFLSLGFIVLALSLAMYQMWPSKLRSYTAYIAYLLMAFVMFIVLLGVVRLILFAITFFSHPPGIWLFPNLFADVRFVDSFVPLWSYHGVDTKPKKDGVVE